MFNEKLIIVDVESGGLDADKHSLLSVGLVLWSKENWCLDTREFYVLEETLHIGSDLIFQLDRGYDISKIVNWDRLRQEGKEPSKICQEISMFLLTNNLTTTPMLVGQNVRLDIEFLKRLYRLAGIPHLYPFDFRYIDTQSIAKFLSTIHPNFPSNTSLNSLFDYFDIKVKKSDRHTALGDALGTAELLTRMIEFVEGKNDRILCKSRYR